MVYDDKTWRIGSFTKQLRISDDFKSVWECIKVGFESNTCDVSREIFERRVKKNMKDFSDRFPAVTNLFLFSEIRDGVDYLVSDELVFQAIKFGNTPEFRKLAMFSLFLSMAGTWKRAKKGQRYPTRWINSYVRDRIAGDFKWNIAKISKDDVVKFLEYNKNYPISEVSKESTRKIATNFVFMLDKANIKEFLDKNINKWWVDCLFLALDRIILNNKIDGIIVSESDYRKKIMEINFFDLTGGNSIEKKLALNHLLPLYKMCGGLERFDDEKLRERVNKLPETAERANPNEDVPIGALHISNPRILKMLPAFCAMLAKYVGFKVLSFEELKNFNLEDFIQTQTEQALLNIKQNKLFPNLTSAELKILLGE